MPEQTENGGSRPDGSFSFLRVEEAVFAQKAYCIACVEKEFKYFLFTRVI